MNPIAKFKAFPVTGLPVFLFLFFLSGIAFPQSALDRLVDDLANNCKRHQVPGGAILVVHQDSTWLKKGFGKDQKIGSIDEKTVFRIGSISKIFVGLALMKLYEEDEVWLSEKIENILPSLLLEYGNEDFDSVNLRHLLEHTAGLEDMRFSEYFKGKGNNGDWNEWLILQSKSKKVRWNPGTAHAYSNASYTIVAGAISKISGRNYQQYLASEILRPLGFEGNGIDLEPGKQVLTGPHDREGVQYEKESEIFFKPAAGMIASIDDLEGLANLFLQPAYLDGKFLLKESTLELMSRPLTTIAAQNGMSYGYGPGLRSELILGWHAFGYRGAVPGYKSAFYWLPEMDLCFAILTNGDGADMNELEQITVESLRKELHLERKMPQIAFHSLTSEEEGYYQFSNPRNEIAWILDFFLSNVKVVWNGRQGAIHDYFSGDRLFYPVSDSGMYAYKGGIEAQIYFGTDEEGERFFVAGNRHFKKTSLFSVFMKRAFVFLTLLILPLSLISFVRVWTRKKKEKSIAGFNTRLAHSLNALILLTFYFLFRNAALEDLTSIGFQSISIFILSIAFPFFVIVAFLGLFRGFRQGWRGPSLIFNLLVFCDFLFLSGIAVSFDLVGVRLWGL